MLIDYLFYFCAYDAKPLMIVHKRIKSIEQCLRHPNLMTSIIDH